MLLLKILQQLIKTLNSEGTPGQVAAGLALGSVLGLTPLVNLHNLLVLAAIMLYNVSFPAAMLGWALFLPAGFALDPLFDRVGQALLIQAAPLEPLWTALANVPVIPLSNFNNTIVLGSFAAWVLLVAPVYLLAQWGVGQYRAKVYPRLANTRAFQVIKASRLYNLYRLFQTD